MEIKTLRVAAANLRDDMASAYADVVWTRADVYAFPEALPATASAAELDALRKLYGQLGYNAHFASSNDIDDRGDQHYIALLVRATLHQEVMTISLATRNTLAVAIGDLLVVPVHLDDRSEAARRKQIRYLRRYLDFMRTTPGVKNEVVLGDFNATHPSALGYVVAATAKCWQWLRLPSHMPDDADRTWLGRYGGLLTRLGGMMTSRSLNLLEAMGFRDGDRWHQPTMPNVLPVAQLDHVMVRDATVTSFRLEKFAKSDHRGVIATITYTA